MLPLIGKRIINNYSAITIDMTHMTVINNDYNNDNNDNNDKCYYDIDDDWLIILIVMISSINIIY